MLNTILKTCKSYLDFDNKIKSNKTNGNLFECFSKYYFMTYPTYYSVIDKVYLYNEIPIDVLEKLNLPTKDKGIDILLKYKSGEIIPVQCKFRSNRDITVSWKDLSTFVGMSFGMNNKINRAIYVTNTYNINKDILKSNKIIVIDGYFLDEYVTGSKFKNIVNISENSKIKFLKRVPYDFQSNIIELTNKHYDENNKGNIELICGSGKTLLSFWIAKEYKNIVVFVPSLILLSQFFEEWMLEFLSNKINKNYLLIGSRMDTEIKDNYKEYINNIFITTDKEEIKSKLINNIFVICTYQSAFVLFDVLKDKKFSFDFGVYDEAHKTVGQKDKSFSITLNDEFPIIKRLFMTATPKIYIGQNEEAFSMDDEKIYGKKIYKYNMYDAIKDDKLCDYQIVSYHTTNNYIKKMINDNNLLNLLKELELEDQESVYIACGIIILKMFSENSCSHLRGV